MNHLRDMNERGYAMTEHESGQTRIDAAGDQLSALPLPDEAIPSQPVDTEAAREQERRRCMCPDDCNCHYPWRTNYCGCDRHAVTLEIGQHVENIHPYNRGRYPVGVVIGGGFGNGQVTVQIGKGSTVYGPAAHWQPTDRRPDWIA